MTFEHFAKAIAEFEFTLVFANAPLDRFLFDNPFFILLSWNR
jgi:hypothetical protein